MEGSIFAKSIELMVVGMGMTFIFLILLVAVMNILKVAVEGYLNKWFPPAQPASTAAAVAVSDEKVRIAIALAVAKSMAK